MLDLRRLTVFREVARQRSFSAAAATGIGHAFDLPAAVLSAGQRRRAAQPQRLRHRALVHARRLDERAVLLVERKRQIELRRALHGALDQGLVHQRDAVVGKSRGPVGGKLFHVHQLAPAHATADGRAR